MRRQRDRTSDRFWAKRVTVLALGALILAGCTGSPTEREGRVLVGATSGAAAGGLLGFLGGAFIPGAIVGGIVGGVTGFVYDNYEQQQGVAQ